MPNTVFIISRNILGGLFAVTLVLFFWIGNFGTFASPIGVGISNEQACSNSNFLATPISNSSMKLNEPSLLTTDKTRRVPVDTVEALEKLKLIAKDAKAKKAVSILKELILEKTGDTTFTLALRFPTKPPAVGSLIDPDGYVLETIAESGGVRKPQGDEGQNDRCTSIYPLSYLGQTILVPIDPRDQFKNMQCGNIATIHSAIKLGLLSPDEAFEGQHLKQEEVRRLNRFHFSDSTEVGMTSSEIQEAHKSYAKPGKNVNCIQLREIDINASTVSTSLRNWASLFNSQVITFDCSIRVKGDYGADGIPRTTHVEHITSMKQNATGGWEITTVDGFNQGATDATIPKSPGTNTWEFGSNMGRFKSGSKKNMAQHGNVVFERVKLECCYVI